MKDHPRQTSRSYLDDHCFPAAIFSDPHALNVVFEDGWRWENGQLNWIHTTLLVIYQITCEGLSYNLLRKSCLTFWYGAGRSYVFAASPTYDRPGYFSLPHGPAPL